MTSILLAFSLLSSPRPADFVADFFPLNPGDKYTYIETAGSAAYKVTDTVGDIVKIKEEEAIPVGTKSGATDNGSTFYRIVDDTVYVIAYDAKTPLEEAIPVMKIGDREVKWDFAGMTSVLDDKNTAMIIKGSSHKAGQKQVLGQKRDIYEVTLDIQVGAEKGGFKSKQVAEYARGIGLVMMKETSIINKKKTERTRTLSEYKPKG